MQDVCKPSKRSQMKQEDHSNEDSELGLENLTNKKKEYLQQVILDKNGQFDYVHNPGEYKKARK